MLRLVLPNRFAVCGRCMHRHAAKVQRDGIDILGELHRAERHVAGLLPRPLTDDQRRVFRESIRDANRHRARRAAEDRQRPVFINTFA